MKRNSVITIETLVNLFTLPKEFRLINQSTRDVAVLHPHEFITTPKIVNGKVSINKYESIKNCIVVVVHFDKNGIYSITYDDSNEITESTREMTEVESYLYRLYLNAQTELANVKYERTSYLYGDIESHCCVGEEYTDGSYDAHDSCSTDLYLE